MPYGEVGRKATNKYRSKYSMLQVRVEPAEKEAITQHAKECGESVNAFVARAIKETAKRDIRRKKRQQKRDQQLTKEDSRNENNI